MEKVEKQSTQTFFYINAAIQFSAIFAFQLYAMVWPLYIVMFLLSLIILLQTIAAAGAFSQIVETNKNTDKKSPGIAILISMIYAVSCYHIYMIGFIGFAWVAAAHVTIQFLTNFFGALKQ